jgi:siroheme synthase (precorrin-2 oxidase/ferrochelatase)
MRERERDIVIVATHDQGVQVAAATQCGNVRQPGTPLNPVHSKSAECS